MTTGAPESLDEACSQHFTWRDIVECGQTWRRLASSEAPGANLPVSPETWQSIAVMAQHILDPIVDEFGRLELTYGGARHDKGTSQAPLAPRSRDHPGAVRATN